MQVEHGFNNGPLPAAHLPIVAFNSAAYTAGLLPLKKIQASAEKHANIPEVMFSSVQQLVQHDTAILNILSFISSDQKSLFHTYVHTHLENTQIC